MKTVLEAKKFKIKVLECVKGFLTTASHGREQKARMQEKEYSHESESS